MIEKIEKQMGLRQGIIGRRSSSKNLVLVGLHHSKAITRMDEAATLKAELKRFEKDFKAREGRAPGKADIKAHPEIGKACRVALPCLYDELKLDINSAQIQVVQQQTEGGYKRERASRGSATRDWQIVKSLCFATSKRVGCFIYKSSIRDAEKDASCGGSNHRRSKHSFAFQIKTR